MIYQVEELSIELTNECLMKCIHCSSGSLDAVCKEDELTFSEHFRLLAEARGLGATVFSASGGEPLLYNNLVELVSEAIVMGYERVLIYTTGRSHNGDAIWHYKRIQELLGLPAVTWIFSLHSHNSVTNDTIMGINGATSNIKKSIRWLTGVESQLSEDVEIHMVPMAPNYQDIAPLRIVCHELGVMRMSVLRFVPQTRGRDNIDMLRMTRAQFAEMQFLLNYHLEDELNPVELRAGCPIDFRHAVGLLQKKAKICHAGDDLILVRPDGSVHPCAAWKSLPSDSNVREASLEWIWRNSRVFNAIRMFKRGEYLGSDGQTITGYTRGAEEVAFCAACSLFEGCVTGCPAQRLHAYGDSDIEDLSVIQWSDPLCPRGNGL